MKISPSELRIGNVVYDSLGEFDVVIDGITKSKEEYGYEYVVEFDDSMSATVLKDFNGEQYIKPISLTAEWLLKLGFSNEIDEELPEDAEFLCFFKDNIDVELQPSLMGGHDVVGITLYEEVVDEEGQLASQGCYEIKTDINYVHQLQNLYFALTGTELELKN